MHTAVLRTIHIEDQKTHCRWRCFANHMDQSSVRSAMSDEKCTAYRTFPGPPHVPHTLSIDFAPSPKADGEATAEEVVLAGVELGGCLVSVSNGLWETRHGSIIANTNRPQLCRRASSAPGSFQPKQVRKATEAAVGTPNAHAACEPQPLCTMPCLTHTNTSCQV